MDEGLRLQPMVHVEDMAASAAFYEALGAQVVHGSRDGDWVLLRLGGAEIGLLAHPPNPEQGEGTVGERRVTPAACVRGRVPASSDLPLPRR